MVENNIVYHFNTKEKSEKKKFEYRLQKMLRKKLNCYQQVIILCIGSDCIIGDCLGPLIGYKLAFSCYGGITVYGTLESPVHAMNFYKVMDTIDRKYCNPFIIAIDSSMGEHSDIGNVTLREAGILPGIAFGKTLSQVGNIGITGIVVQSDITFEEFTRATRMRLVMQIADFITTGLLNSLDSVNLISNLER